MGAGYTGFVGNIVNGFKKVMKTFIYRVRGEVTTEELIRRGLKVGVNFKRLNHVMIDDSHTWLIEIGDNVTLAPNVHILAHDASTKSFLGYTRIARVTIGNNVFIGAGSIVLPGVRIGDNVVIGANSTVTHDINENTVAVGSPAEPICTLSQYLKKERERMETSPVYDASYTMRRGITPEMKEKQKKELTGKVGYVD